MDLINKVKSWAEDNKGGARFVAGDTNVTYEDILKVCEMAKPAKADLPKRTPEAPVEDEGVEDVDNGLDNSDGS